jgi:acyl-CoA synthetase (AMP-forming)/AMP-acid ligase II
MPHDDLDRSLEIDWNPDGDSFPTSTHPPLPLRHPTVAHAFLRLRTEAPRNAGVTLVHDSSKTADEHQTWSQIVDGAIRVAERLAAEGVSEGDHVLVILPTGWDFLYVFFGTILLRAVPVPTYPPDSLDRVEIALAKLSRIADHAKVSAIVTNHRIQPVIEQLSRPDRPIFTTEYLAEEGPRGTIEKRFRRSETCFIQYTSGSTGTPKGVMLSHHNLIHNVHALGARVRVTKEDSLASWVPLYHDMGLIGVLIFSVYWGIPVVLMSPWTFLINPRRWLEAISSYGITLSTAPNFGYARCVELIKNTEGLDLSSWRLALNGAEIVSASTLAAFEERFAPCGLRKHVFLPVYGLAETCVSASFQEPATPIVTDSVLRDRLAEGYAVAASGPEAVTLVGHGTAIDGHHVWIFDADGRPLPDREVGHIVVQGPSVMTGYYDAPEATAEVLRRDVLWTGDLGYTANGHLFISGRVKDLIIIRGRNYHAEDVENVCERTAGVRAGCTIAFGVYDENLRQDLLVVVAETKTEGEVEREPIAKSIEGDVLAHFGIRVNEIVLVPPRTIPKTSSGKRQRALCRQLYLEQALMAHRTQPKAIEGAGS